MIRKNRSWVVFHVPRSIRLLIRRFSVIIMMVLLMSLVLLSRAESPSLQGLRVLALNIFSPITTSIEAISGLISGLSGNANEYFFVVETNKHLNKENRALKETILSLQQFEQENIRLKRLLKFDKDPLYVERSARVVGQTGGVFRNTILINAGHDSDVRKGQAVVSEHGLVGRIIEVSQNVSRVLLVTDLNSKIPVLTNQSRERAILKGNGTSPPELLYVSGVGAIADGETVITSGDGEVYPFGVEVGRVQQSEAGRYTILPFSKWHALEFVSILQQPQQPQQPEKK